MFRSVRLHLFVNPLNERQSLGHCVGHRTEKNKSLLLGHWQIFGNRRQRSREKRKQTTNTFKWGKNTRAYKELQRFQNASPHSLLLTCYIVQILKFLAFKIQLHASLCSGIFHNSRSKYNYLYFFCYLHTSLYIHYLKNSSLFVQLAVASMKNKRSREAWFIISMTER